MVRWFFTFLVDIVVKMASRKSNVKEKSTLFGIRSSRSLLNAIGIFFKVTKKDRVIVNIGRWLFHVNLLLQIPIKEGGFDIHLMDLPFI